MLLAYLLLLFMRFPKFLLNGTGLFDLEKLRRPLRSLERLLLLRLLLTFSRDESRDREDRPRFLGDELLFFLSAAAAASSILFVGILA